MTSYTEATRIIEDFGRQSACFELEAAEYLADLCPRRPGKDVEQGLADALGRSLDWHEKLLLRVSYQGFFADRGFGWEIEGL